MINNMCAYTHTHPHAHTHTHTHPHADSAEYAYGEAWKDGQYSTTCIEASVLYSAQQLVQQRQC